MNARPPSVERLATELVGSRIAEPFGSEVAGWLSESPRFRAFAEAHRDKIRKKVRGAVDGETLRDVRAELQVARLLLADRRIELEFEAYGSRNVGPDFTVTYRATRTFNVEVTRVRPVSAAPDVGRAVIGKLRQLPPSVASAVLLAMPGDDAGIYDIAAAMRAIRAAADARDAGFLAWAGFETARAFYDRYLRLGAVFVWCEDGGGDARATLWTNASARIPISDRAAAACLACLRGV